MLKVFKMLKILIKRNANKQAWVTSRQVYLFGVASEGSEVPLW
jgi:mannose/cellobiose epimerase-like protein (N-acyl-D-glucosamine 2-epimerase family)